tara:strand:+ start:116 stop:289 length:174 start_codon:yes stop_codon:yes gene_type:complete
MIKFFFLIMILLSSCSLKINEKNNKIDFESFENMSFDEFKLKLNNYAKNNPFPNIDG